MYAPQTDAEMAAYKAGVSQVLTDLRGKMEATERVEFRPAVIECPKVPAATINGVFYPPRETCAMVIPARVIEQQVINLPTKGDNDER